MNSDQDTDNRSQSPRLTWRKPLITRLSLKRTLEGSGSGPDFENESDFVGFANKP